ncbi:MAG: hypothetical protein ABI611_04210 [Solirubrobacteraceae bacterium]
MGLLDDAIKEHLELKRKRGADAEEVSRLEQEALGPPQRGEFAGATAPAEAAEVADAPLPSPPAEEAVAPEPAPVEPAIPEPAPEPEPEPEPTDRAAAPWLEDEEPPEEPEELPEGEPVILDQPTIEYAAPGEPGEASAGDEAPGRGTDGEDVLEETPDFLQETPEHDRLWFEQKPPRDFDLDR